MTIYYKCPCCGKRNSENYVGEDQRIKCLFCNMDYYPHAFNGYDDEFQTLKEKQIEDLH